MWGFLVVFFIIWTVRATLFYDSVDAAIASPAGRAAFSNVVKFTLWVLPAAGFVYFVRRKRPLGYLGLTTYPGARQWGICMAVTAVFLGAVVAVEVLLAGKSFEPARIMNYATAAGIFALVFSPLVEEILFRGLILKELAAGMPQWPANMLTSLLFAAVHVPFWLWNDGATPAVLSNIAGVFIVSLLFGWVYLRTVSVWPAFAAHAANNLVVSLLAG